MEKIRRITFGIMLAAVVCAAAACGRNDTNGSAAGQSSGREESSTAPGSRATEEVPGTSATGVDLPSGESGTDGESGGVIRDMVDDVKDGMEEITTGTTGAGENGTSHGTGDGTTGQTTGGGASRHRRRPVNRGQGVTRKMWDSLFLFPGKYGILVT